MTPLRHENTQNVSHVYPLGTIAIENFKTYYNRKKRMLTYRFLLKNKKDDGINSSGYLFVTLKSALLSPDTWITYPRTTLIDGAPHYYREGDPFTISRYKVITHNIHVHHNYDEATIRVFSEKGDLLLCENFNVPSPSTRMAGN